MTFLKMMNLLMDLKHLLQSELCLTAWVITFILLNFFVLYLMEIKLFLIGEFLSALVVLQISKSYLLLAILGPLLDFIWMSILRMLFGRLKIFEYIHTNNTLVFLLG